MNELDQESPKAVTPQLEELDRSLVKGLAWTGLAKWGSQAVGWAALVIVARILTPDDYGIVSMASVYLGLLTVLSEFGVGMGVVALRDQTDHELAQLNGLSVMFGIAGFIVSCLIAKPLGLFFRSPQLPLVVILMSTSFVITSFRSVPAGLLQKELRFATLSAIDAFKTVILAVVMVMLAAAGFHYWTLVVGAIASNLLSTAIILLKRWHPIAWPRLSSIRHQVRFSRNFVLANLAWYLYNDSDFLVAGRMLGREALGVYTFAWNLANAPLEKITSLVGSVTPAYFSATQHDNAALRRYLLKPTLVISFIAYPALVGLALVAREAVPLLLGQKWTPLIVPVQLLAILCCLRSVGPLLPQILLVKNDVGFVARSAGVCLIVLPLSFLVGSHWGVNGIAAAWIVAYPVIAVPIYLRVRRHIGLTLSDYFHSLRPGIDGTLAMAAIVLLLKHFLPPSITPLARLVLLILTGAGVYCTVQVTFHRQQLNTFRRAVQLLRS